MKVREERLYLTIRSSQRDSWTLSRDLLTTSGKIRDEELENAGVEEARGVGASVRESQGKALGSWKHTAKGSRDTQQQHVSCHSPQKFLQNLGMGLWQKRGRYRLQNKPPPPPQSSALCSSSAPKDCSKAGVLWSQIVWGWGWKGQS